MKKITALLLIFMCLFSLCTVALSFDEGIEYGKKAENPNLTLPQYSRFNIRNGTMVLECEEFDKDSNIALVEDEDASGGAAARVSASSPAMSIDAATLEANLSVDFMNEAPGSFAVWLRVKAPDDGSDSFYYAVNSKNYNMQSLKAGSEYYWISLGTAQLSSGKSNISIKYRERNVHFDKMIITSDMSFTPSGKDDAPEAGSVQTGGTGLYNEPPIKPITGHPRLFVTKKDIPAITENIKTPELATVYSIMKSYADEEFDAKLQPNPGGNYDAVLETKLQARAFMYVIGEKDDAHARKTVALMKDYLSTVSFPSAQDITRKVGDTMITAAMVYDWCYTVLTNSDKTEMISAFKALAALKEIGYPPTKMSSIGSHAGELEIFRDMLGVGVAIYDEDTEMYDLAAGRLFDEFLPSRKLFNASGNHPQGSAYGAYRFQCELWTEIIYRRMGYENVLGEGVENVAYKWLYDRLPFGMWLKDGDDFAFSRNIYFSYNYNDRLCTLLAANIFKDPYLRRQYLKTLSLHSYQTENIWLLLFAEPSVGMKETGDLPLSRKTTFPLSSVTARTSWQTGLDAPTAMAHMKIQEVNLNDHMHLDSGGFQIYYKGSLATTSGIYQGLDGESGGNHYKNYYVRTAAHNCLTVLDPDEVIYGGDATASNDGGQYRLPGAYIHTYEELMANENRRAEAKGTYIGPNINTPKFSYIKGDLTGAYSDKVTDYTRSMVFMDLFDNNYPAAFVVYDNVTSSDKNFKKVWNLHSIEEPEVNGNKTVIKRTGNGFNGKLVNTTLIPAKSNITKVGGDGMEYSIGGINYPNRNYAGTDTEGAAWRIELSPRQQSTNDQFLNAMFVTDADTKLPDLEMKQAESSDMTGVAVMDRLVMFSKDGKTLDKELRLVVPDNGYSNVSCLIADLAPGKWRVSSQEFTTAGEVKAEENALYVEVPPGRYTLTRDESAELVQITYPQMQKPELGDFLVYQEGLFINQVSPFKEINGVPYVPLKSVVKDYGASLGWNEATEEVKITSEFGKTAVIKAGNADAVIDGTIVTLSHIPFNLNGYTYVCLDDFAEFFGIEVRYDSWAKLLRVLLIDRELLTIFNANTVHRAAGVTASAHDGNIPDNTTDINQNTRWSAEGDHQWIMYDLGETKNVSKIYMVPYAGTQRALIFDVEVSEDGINFSRVLSGKTSGTSDDAEEFTFDTASARYVRINCYGNTVNKWNSICELIICG